VNRKKKFMIDTALDFSYFLFVAMNERFEKANSLRNGDAKPRISD
jgi:hypothetical protein